MLKNTLKKKKVQKVTGKDGGWSGNGLLSTEAGAKSKAYNTCYKRAEHLDKKPILLFAERGQKGYESQVPG